VFSSLLAQLYRAIAKGRNSVCLYVCLSVRPSVTLVSHAYAVQHIEINFAPCDGTMFLVS